MSRACLLSLLLSTVPIAIAAAEGLQTRSLSEPGAPPIEAGALAEAAAVPALVMLQQNVLITKLEVDELLWRDSAPGKSASPAEVAARAKLLAEKRAAAWKAIDEVKKRVTGMLAFTETKALAVPALAATGLTRKLSDVHQEMFAARDSGKKTESPEEKALTAKAEVISKSQEEQLQLLIAELKRIKAAVEDERVARKAAGILPPPNPALVLMTEHRRLIKLLVDEIVVRNRYLGTAIPADVQRMLDLHPAQREHSLKEIAECMERFHGLARMPLQGNLAPEAVKLDQAACEVRANMEAVLALVRSGKSQDSPEALALRAKGDAARKSYSEAAVVIQKRLAELGVASVPES